MVNQHILKAMEELHIFYKMNRGRGELCKKLHEIMPAIREAFEAENPGKTIENELFSTKYLIADKEG